MIYNYLSGMLLLLLSMLVLLLSLMFMFNKISFFIEWNVITLNSVEINMFIFIDWIMLLFIFTIFIISSMIMFYCIDYMIHDNYMNRFFYLLLLFIFSMLLMIISPNLISIIIGWDGLGLISYCLIIYYQNINSYNSGSLTIILNRIGDITMVIGMSMMFMLGSWNFMFYNNISFLLLLLIMISSFSKSAQFPFSSWLPAAMAAPTPVSSLVHSSTLVTAGVYLMIRFNYLLFKNIILMNCIMLISMITMLMSGMLANFEFDLKKIIAFSTLSQLGLMLLIFSFKNFILCFFHLIIHAMFKSMMFMCSGVIIHMMLNYQDIRYMGKLKEFMPLTMMMLLISNFSLCGLPFMSGFYSKDQILEFILMNYNNLLIYLLLMLSTGLTISYSIRLLYYLMNINFMFINFLNIKDSKLMNWSMLLLMILSIISGNILNWLLYNNIELIFLMNKEKLSILFICLIFLFLSLTLSKLKFGIKINIIIYMLGKMMFMYNFIPMMIIYPMKFSKNYMKLYDKGWSEYFIKNSLILLINKFNNMKMFNVELVMFLMLINFYIFMMIYLNI